MHENSVVFFVSWAVERNSKNPKKEKYNKTIGKTKYWSQSDGILSLSSQFFIKVPPFELPVPEK